MKNYAPESCNGNDFTSFREKGSNCTSKCETNSTVSEQENDKCCFGKCMFLDHFLVSDGKTNKSAVAGLFGPVGDPKIMENIDECEAIGKK